MGPPGVAELIDGQNGEALPYIMLVSMITARAGLWSFDLCITQMMQTRVADAMRAQVNGTQMALSQIFCMASSLLTMVFHRVDDFFTVVWVTEATIFMASVVYSLWFVLPWCQQE